MFQPNLGAAAPVFQLFQQQRRRAVAATTDTWREIAGKRWAVSCSAPAATAFNPGAPMRTVAQRSDAPLQHNSVERSSPGGRPIRLRLPAGPSPDVAIAVLTAKRRQTRSEFTRLEREVAEARRQQLNMMPRDFPCVSGGHRVDMHAVTYPAREVGGDLYDAFEVAPGVICIAVGDVVGTGLPAALFMARARSVLRAVTLQFIAITGRIPVTSDVARIVNAELCKGNDDCMFMTLFIGLLDLESGRLGFTNAGHVRPYLVRPHLVRAGLRIERLDVVLAFVSGEPLAEIVARRTGLAFKPSQASTTREACSPQAFCSQSVSFLQHISEYGNPLCSPNEM